jgi:hypothetical protein
MKEREEPLVAEEKTSPATRTLPVSLDTADAVIEGGTLLRGKLLGALTAAHKANLTVALGCQLRETGGP